MSPMSDQPLTRGVLTQVLVEFHRDVIVPDMHRTFEAMFERLVKPRFDEIDGRFDSVFQQLDKLETEYQSLKAGLARLEEGQKGLGQRLDGLEAQYRDLLAAVNRLEERLDGVERRLGTVEERLDGVEERLGTVDERLGRVEGQVDALVAATENDPLRAEVADLRRRVDSLQAQVRSLEKRFDT